MSDFLFCELDNEQSESRCTAYLSGDTNLISAVESPRDFHAINIERFFGVPYNQVIGPNGEVLNKELRNLSKRVNHGANYNMGPEVLLKTMGEENVDRAKILLNLPPYWTRIRVCEHLLELYAKAYPDVKTIWYNSVKTQVRTAHKLVSPLGWTRYCFGQPDKNKRDLNAYVAHPPQNLSVSIINEGFKELFWKIQIPNSKDFRLKAQIHDSIFFQFRIGKEHLIEQAKKICIRTVPVTDCKGITRTMTIPVATKIGKNWKDMEKWPIQKFA
jgi:DNA polymerase I-like protein with 3'-5' exonuclease and polymerase domains